MTDFLARRQIRLCLLVVQSGDRIVISVADHTIVGKVDAGEPVLSQHRRDAGWLAGLVHPEGHRQDPGFRCAAAVQSLKTLDTGPITNHVNIVHNANGTFAYVTVGGLNEVKVFRTDNFEQVATIPVGKLPHGIWPSGDGTRVYVGLESRRSNGRDRHADATKSSPPVPIGQAPQAVVYVPQRRA